MSRAPHYLDIDDQSRERNLRFLNNDMEDSMNRLFGERGGGSNGAVAPPRDYKIVTPRAEGLVLEEEIRARKEFFQDLDLPRHEAYDWAKRTMDMQSFRISYFLEKKIELTRTSRLPEDEINRRIFEEICDRYRRRNRNANLSKPPRIARRRRTPSPFMEKRHDSVSRDGHRSVNRHSRERCVLDRHSRDPGYDNRSRGSRNSSQRHSRLREYSRERIMGDQRSRDSFGFDRDSDDEMHVQRQRSRASRSPIRHFREFARADDFKRLRSTSRSPERFTKRPRRFSRDDRNAILLHNSRLSRSPERNTNRSRRFSRDERNAILLQDRPVNLRHRSPFNGNGRLEERNYDDRDGFGMRMHINEDSSHRRIDVPEKIDTRHFRFTDRNMEEMRFQEEHQLQLRDDASRGWDQGRHFDEPDSFQRAREKLFLNRISPHPEDIDRNIHERQNIIETRDVGPSWKTDVSSIWKTDVGSSWKTDDDRSRSQNRLSISNQNSIELNENPFKANLRFSDFTENKETNIFSRLGDSQKDLDQSKSFDRLPQKELMESSSRPHPDKDDNPFIKPINLPPSPPRGENAIVNPENPFRLKHVPLPTQEDLQTPGKKKKGAKEKKVKVIIKEVPVMYPILDRTRYKYVNPNAAVEEKKPETEPKQTSIPSYSGKAIPAIDNAKPVIKLEENKATVSYDLNRTLIPISTSAPVKAEVPIPTSAPVAIPSIAKAKEQRQPRIREPEPEVKEVEVVEIVEDNDNTTVEYNGRYWSSWWEKNEQFLKHIIPVADDEPEITEILNKWRPLLNVKEYNMRTNLIQQNLNTCLKVLQDCEKATLDSFSGGKHDILTFFKSLMAVNGCLSEQSELDAPNLKILQQCFRVTNKFNMAMFYQAVVAKFERCLCKPGQSIKISLSNNKLLHWLTDLAFKEIKLIIDPILNPKPFEEKLQILYDFIVKDQDLDENNLCIRKRLSIKQFEESRNPVRDFKAYMNKRKLWTDAYLSKVTWNDLTMDTVFKYLSIIFKLSNTKLNWLLDDMTMIEKDKYLKSLKTHPKTKMHYSYVFEKYINIQERVTHLNSIHPRLRLIKEEDEISSLINSLKDEDGITTRYMIKCILDERKMIYGNYSAVIELPTS